MTQPLIPANLTASPTAKAALDVLAQMFEYYDYQKPARADDVRQAA